MSSMELYLSAANLDLEGGVLYRAAEIAYQAGCKLLYLKRGSPAVKFQNRSRQIPLIQLDMEGAVRACQLVQQVPCTYEIYPRFNFVQLSAFRGRQEDGQRNISSLTAKHASDPCKRGTEVCPGSQCPDKGRGTVFSRYPVQSPG